MVPVPGVLKYSLPSVYVRNLGGALLAGLPEHFVVGRYHSLHARRLVLPPVFRVTAETEDGVVMKRALKFCEILNAGSS
jgi:anthranilate/para-aminobenzoate synthase component II